jgi:hypothetical protein
VTDTRILAARLKNQCLVDTSMRTPEAIVSWLGAVQAQDYAGAKWAIGLRTTGLTDADVERAFEAGRILRTHVLRPTWHFVVPADIRWMLALTGSRVHMMNRRYGHAVGLDERVFTRGRAAIERALEGGRQLTRAEISAALHRARLRLTGQQLAHLLMDVEVAGSICSGPRRGRQFTYALLAERVPDARVLPRDEALAELTGRYFQSHGPATLRDFAWWSGLAMKDARAGVEMTKSDVLVKPPEADSVRGATYLLPNYDEYLIAYKDRRAIIDPARVRNLGVFTTAEHPHYLIVDGRVAGSWRRTLGSSSVGIDVATYDALRRGQRNTVVDAARRFAQFLQLECSLRL